MLDNFINSYKNGFGQVPAEELDELRKALDTGSHAYSTATPGALTQGAALQVESLDATLRNVTFRMSNLKLWPDLPKSKAENTVEEYNLQQNYGGDNPVFFTDGGLPNSEDASYSREVELVKFLGTTRSVTHPLTLVKPAHGPIIAREIKNGTMWILEKLERALFNADSAIQSLEFDGISKQIQNKGSNSEYKGDFPGFGDDQDVVIDVRDAVLDEDLLEEGANRIAENFGFPSTLYLDTRAHSDLSKQFYPKERIPNMGQADGKAGYVLKQFVSSAGNFDLKGNVFNRPRRKPVTGVGNAPSSVNGADSTEASGSEWLTADQGDYIYGVSAVYSASGESPAAFDASAYSKANNNNVDVTWVAPTPPSGESILYYNVFRSEKDGASSSAEFIARVAGGTVTYRDKNAKLPGLSDAFLCQMDAESFGWKQLAPLMKMDLAIVAAAYRWMQLLYGTPIVYTPRKNIIFENIGRATSN